MKCPNCGNVIEGQIPLTYNPEIERYRYHCEICGCLWLWGIDTCYGDIVVPEFTRWRKFDEEPLLGNLILIRHYYGNITACCLQSKCEIEDFKELKFSWIPVFLPEEEKK